VIFERHREAIRAVFNPSVTILSSKAKAIPKGLLLFVIKVYSFASNALVSMAGFTL